MDAQTVLDQMTKKVLYEMMIASRVIEPGSIEPEDLTPKLGDVLDRNALQDIQNALRFAQIFAPRIAERAHDEAAKLIDVLKRKRELKKGKQLAIQI